MLRKHDFDRHIQMFETEFTDKLSNFRKELLYRRLSSLDTYYLNEGLSAVVEKYNKDELPTVETITNIALNSCPEAFQLKQVDAF